MKKYYFIIFFIVFFSSYYAQNTDSPEKTDIESPSPSKKKLSLKESQEDSSKDSKKNNQETHRWIIPDYDLDPYYSSVYLIFNLTSRPIPNMGGAKEWEIYRYLFLNSYKPRNIVIEASINPLPLTGVGIRHYHPDIYRGSEIQSFNTIEAIVADFEEPYAASFFVGNVVSFETKETETLSGNKGYSGYLFSTGNYHIKDSVLIEDFWYEAEAKIKGERFVQNQSLYWSFRLGTKVHDNPEIKDVVYISFKRSSLDYKAPVISFIFNSGFEYTFFMDYRTANPIRHYFVIDKKYPMCCYAFRLRLGVLWESYKKYTGSLAEDNPYKKNEWQFVIQPNITF